jgi:hypothetical protein
MGINYPRTLQEAVQALVSTMTENEKDLIRSLTSVGSRRKQQREAVTTACVGAEGAIEKAGF